jgi:hypothetical protein
MLKHLQARFGDIATYLSKSPILDDLLLYNCKEISDLDMLVKFTNNTNLSIAVLGSNSVKFMNRDKALAQYDNPKSVLIYIEMLSIHLLFDDCINVYNMIKNIESSITIRQLLKCDFPQKVVFGVTKVSTVSSFISDISIVELSSNKYQITINDIMCKNFKEVKKEFQTILNNIDPTDNTIFLPRVGISNLVKYIVVDISEISSSNPDVLKNIEKVNIFIQNNLIEEVPVIETAQTKRQATLIKNNQATITWVRDNEPLIDETKLDYYAKYLKNNVPITQQTFTVCIKNCGFSETKNKGKLYWLRNA